MRILQVHNFYLQAGGEDEVLWAENRLLTRRGHQVQQLLKRNDKLSSIQLGFEFFVNTHYSKSGREKIAAALEEFHPDVMHVHNFFPLFSPSIYDACAERNIPVVQTLHNFRILHPNALLYHNGEVDERPLSGSAYQCVSDRVYRKSILQTTIVAHMIEYHKRRDTWNKKVTRFIALTDFCKMKFVQGGILPHKIEVKPNFASEPKQLDVYEPPFPKDAYCLFVGRLSEEKGVRTLLNAWEQQEIPLPLVIAGSGPFEQKLKGYGSSDPRIRWLGHRPKDEIMGLMQNALALVFPSLWYEAFPMTIVEAFASGLPVIASRLGSMAELIEDGRTGYLFEPGNTGALASAVRRAHENREELNHMKSEARKEYERLYMPERNYRMLISIYERAIEDQHN